MNRYVKLDGSLAQLVEQLAFNQLVEGSNPSRPTTFLKVLPVRHRFRRNESLRKTRWVVSSVGRAVGF